MLAELQAQLLRAALEVSVLLVVVYGITTSAIGGWLRVPAMKSWTLYTLFSCAYCTGWWAAVLVAHWHGDVLQAPLYFMAVPIVRSLLPDFITGPSETELGWYKEAHKQADSQ